MISQVDIHGIVPNEFQQRLAEDPEHVKELAVSIATDDMLQIPSGRKHANGTVELAFGHSRWAAYSLLACAQEEINGNKRQLPTTWDEEYRTFFIGLVENANQNGRSFLEIPVNVVELTDEQMFRYATVENIKRRNLTPIEEARAMQTYMTTFRKTSEQCGELFGKDAATVRGVVRLLDLPEPVQEQVQAGAITTNTARKLLTVQRVAPKAAEKAAEQMNRDMNPDEIDRRLAAAMRQSRGTVIMWQSYDGDPPRAGRGLWPLEWRHKGQGLPFLCGEDLLKTCGYTEKAKHYEQKLEAFGEMLRYLEGGMEIKSQALTWSMQGITQDDVDTAARYYDPPVCLDCPVYARLDGMHYCGWKTCHERKRVAWAQQELGRISQETGLLPYEDKDGEYITINYAWGEQQKELIRRVKEGDPTLRLKTDPQSTSYSSTPVINSHVVQLLDTSPEAIKELHKNALDAKEQERRFEHAQECRKNCEKSRVFLRDSAAAIFAPALAGIKSKGTLSALYRRMIHEDAGEMSANDMRRGIIYSVLDDEVEYEQMEQGTVAVARHLQGVATTWGVELPDDWLEIAARFDAPSDALQDAEDERKAVLEITGSEDEDA